MNFRAGTFVLVFACFTSSGVQADDTGAALKTQNANIVAQSPGDDGVFTVQDDGSIRHVQSGLVCPAKYPNVSLYAVLVYSSDAGKGLDVGCDYRRADLKGGAWSKLTIFATKAASGTTLDRAFTRYQNEIAQVWPQAKPLGEVLRVVQTDDPPAAAPDIRSAEYAVLMNDQQYTSDLIVSMQSGWVIEIRTTYVGLPNAIDAVREGKDSAVLEMGDRIVGPKALFDALGSIGR